MSVSQDDRHESLHFASAFCIYSLSLCTHKYLETLPHTHTRVRLATKNSLIKGKSNKGAAGQAKKAWSLLIHNPSRNL